MLFIPDLHRPISYNDHHVFRFAYSYASNVKHAQLGNKVDLNDARKEGKRGERTPNVKI